MMHLKWGTKTSIDLILKGKPDLTPFPLGSERPMITWSLEVFSLPLLFFRAISLTLLLPCKRK
jgi:hypothetical protein